MSVQKSGEFPMFMGYCKFANCTRSIQIKVVDIRKLELQYSGEDKFFTTTVGKKTTAHTNNSIHEFPNGTIVFTQISKFKCLF